MRRLALLLLEVKCVRKSSAAAVLLFFSAVISLLKIDPCGADQYWISFAREGPPPSSTNFPPIGPECLMKIDGNGNILVRPHIVIPNTKFFVSANGASAISHGQSGKLNFYTFSRKEDQCGSNSIYRAVIDARTLALDKFQKTGICTGDVENIQTTQREEKNFLSIDSLVNYEAHEVDSNGSLTGGKWVLAPSDQNGRGFGVSADGKVFFNTQTVSPPTGANKTKLIAQHLDSDGRPRGKPVLIEYRRGFSAAMDISNVLPNNRRFAIFSTVDNALNLDVIDGQTMQKIGRSIKLPKAFPVFQNAAIDPNGHFVVYFGFLKFPPSPLIYQSLDATGHPSGEPKVLAINIHGGIDILKD